MREREEEGRAQKVHHLEYSTANVIIEKVSPARLPNKVISKGRHSRNPSGRGVHIMDIISLLGS